MWWVHVGISAHQGMESAFTEIQPSARTLAVLFMTWGPEPCPGKLLFSSLALDRWGGGVRSSSRFL